MTTGTDAAQPSHDAGFSSSGTARQSRAIGPAGTIARILGGGTLVGIAIEAEISGGFTPIEWTLALVAFPGVLLAAQWAWVRHTRRPLHATGPLAHLATLGLFVALRRRWWPRSPAHSPGSCTSTSSNRGFGVRHDDRHSAPTRSRRGGCSVTPWSPRSDRRVTRGARQVTSITHMTYVSAGLERVRRLLHGGSTQTCFVCRRPIVPSDERLKLRGDTVVHRRCATYRLRNRRSSDSRLGYPR